MASTAPRATYRHGDLRQALVDAGFAMARESGPDAVVLREATRRAGVSPNAAYRHFADRTALVQAVSDAALGAVAEAIEEEWERIARAGDAAADAHAELEAVGVGYLRFARDEPGLFRAAFTVPRDLRSALSPDKAGPRGRTPFELLGIALDDLVAAGELPAERRPGAELLAWSAVHGLAMLALEGPLHDLDPELARQTGRRVIAMVDRGL
ncbi:TetR/AcrR family transcriptional regulator [Schumannella luteola]|uniref:AcrR family transcriptional regulator n=1 Tax=Schumannella luteola TaxID=472059 RepID=A0A852YD89_9MICO|nr:TetR/AcrR family transcriptional regulator [Schumannella luteola]NYH00494.1 AcrR family transcriptional regulator [Schumannella luteola]TPX06248.1 TetR/AcrR family transcriptional regulator [Schumannella luteola]